MVKTYSFYDAATGLFTGKQMRCEDVVLTSSNLPRGVIALEGIYNHLNQRVDLASGRIVRHRPPAPSEDHVWDHQMHRWQLNADAGTDDESRRALILSRIQVLEVNQGRALREATLGDASALRRLKEIDDAIKALRLELA